MNGIQLFCFVFHCVGFSGVGAEQDATHIETQSCARARANSTIQNNRTAFVLLSTVFVQPCTIQCNARALFPIVLNQYNQEQWTLLCFALCFTVSLCINAILSSTIQCNGMQSCKSPPRHTPTPTPIIIIHSHTEKFVLHILLSAAVL